MEPVIVKVRSADPSFLDFYGRLAHLLGDAGTVYVPYPLIPPNARMAVPPPGEVLVAFTARECFQTLCDAARSYLEADPELRLTFESHHGAVRADAQRLPTAPALLRELAGADQEAPGVEPDV
ncbi:MAG TPA: hypothetical protein VGG06_09770 [Thermoanaerobaculia bacterium]|jgi:hypothetical protein